MFVTDTVPDQVTGEEDPGAEGGDEYDGDGDTDSEIDDDDRWTCQSCSTRNHPITRHCAKCWGQRHEWMSKRYIVLFTLL